MGVALLIALLSGCLSTSEQSAGLAASGTGASGAVNSPGTTTWPGSSGPTVAAIAGTTLGGAHLSVARLTGNVVVVNAWASWCYPCRTESPALALVARETAGRGITFLGLDEQDARSAAMQFAATVHCP